MNNHLKQFLLDFYRSCRWADYRRLRRSRVFDSQYYLSRYPDVKEANVSPIFHYLNFGWRELRLASPIFDPRFYSERYNINKKVDPLTTYLKHGTANDHFPCAWFDPVFYRERYLQQGKKKITSIDHFLKSGLSAQFYPNREIATFRQKPVLSILVPVYNPDPDQLNNCIRSLVYQSYPHWELCLADDCSSDKDIRPCLRKWAATDPRIKIVFLDKNSGISTATNRAGQLATGNYLGFLDNDDELAPQALATLVREINSNGGELFYSDEDLIGTDGKQHSIFRKPSFNRVLLYSHNYVTHFVLVTRMLFERVGGCNPLHDGAQDFDLFLRLSEQARTITHIPEILYHWRATPTSTSINHSEKDYANEAGRLAIEKSLARCKVPATVENTGLKYYYRARRRIDNEFSATIVVYAEPEQADADVWLGELLNRTTDRTFLAEVVVVVPKAGRRPSLQTLAERYKVKMRIIAAEDSPVAGYNLGSKGVATDFIIFTSTSIKIVNGEWLTSLIEYGQDEETGMVGGRIVCKNEKLEPVTHIPDISQTSEAYYCRFMTNCSVLMNGRHCPQEVSAVNTELSLLKTADFIAAGGFNSSDFPYIFATLDLCYRLRRHGKINIFTPYSQAVWQSDDVPLMSVAENGLLMIEKNKFMQTWREVLQMGDPFYNDKVVSDHDIAVTDFHKWRSGAKIP